MLVALALVFAVQEPPEIQVQSRTFKPKFKITERQGEVKPVELWVRTERGEWLRAAESGVAVEWRGYDGTWLYTTVTVPSDGTYEFFPQVGDKVSNTSPPPSGRDRGSAKFVVDTRTQVGPPQWIAPRAGDELRAGDSATLRWRVPAGYRPGSVSIYAAIDGGSERLVERNLALEDSRSWTVPPGANARLRLVAVTDAGQSREAAVDVRIRAVEIVAPPRWISPAPGTEAAPNDTLTLSWSVPSRGYRANSVTIDVSVDGGAATAIDQNLPLSGTKAWRVPAGKTATLRLSAVEESGRTAQATTDVRIGVAVRIERPVFLQPRKDDAIPADTTIVLSWKAPAQGYAADSVAIYWSVDDEGEQLVANSLPLQGRREWKTPNRPGGRLTLKLIAKTSAGREMGEVLKDLSILPSLEVDLRWLRPGEPGAWTGGETVQLQWTSLRSNVRSGSVTLAYSIDNAPWTPITKGLDPAGFYLWTVPWKSTENLKLRVSGATLGGTATEAVSPTMTVRAGERPNLAHAKRHADAGRIHAARHQWVRAIEEYEKSLAIWPENPEALHDLGNAYKHERQYAKALEYYLRAKKASPALPHPYVSAAGMEMELGLRDDALADLRDAVELGLDEELRLALAAGERLLRLANDYAAAGDEARSDECCRLILRIRNADRSTRQKAQTHLERPRKP